MSYDIEFKSSDGKNLTQVKFRDEWQVLKGLKLADIEELAKNIQFFEEHFCKETDAKPLTKEEVHEFIKDSTKKQKMFLKVLVNNEEGILTKDILKEMNLKNSSQVAGLMSGFSRRHKRDHADKEVLIGQEWDDDEYMYLYWIDEDCYDIVKKYFKEESS